MKCIWCASSQPLQSRNPTPRARVRSKKAYFRLLDLRRQKQIARVRRAFTTALNDGPGVYPQRNVAADAMLMIWKNLAMRAVEIHSRAFAR